MKKLLSLLSLTLCTAVMLSSYACAYIDPSRHDLHHSAIAGAGHRRGRVAGSLLAPRQEKVSQKLGIDENRNKEVESDVLEIKEDADASKPETTGTSEAPRNKPVAPKSGEKSFSPLLHIPLCSP